MGTTNIYNLPYPEPIDPPNGPAQMLALAEAVEDQLVRIDADVAAVQTGIDAAWTAYTPTWTGSSANPSIGNGTIVGAYKLTGKTCHFRVVITMGTTTTYGNGYYSISLPATAIDGQVCNAHARDASAAVEIACSGRLEPDRILRMHTGDGQWVTNTTFVWASGDAIFAGGTYEAA